MFNKGLLISLCLMCQSLLAAQSVDLYQAPFSSLKEFPIQSLSKPVAHGSMKPVADTNALQQINQTLEEGKTIIRYQQLYKGVPVVGAQIMISKGTNQGISAQSNALVNGHLLKDIQINITPTLDGKQAIAVAKKAYFSTSPQIQTQQEVSQLQIRPEGNEELKLVYLVSFKGLQEDNKPVWPFFIVDARTGAITKQWNNIKNYSDSGPGGNEKVHQYWYGKDGLPGLEVTQNGTQCVMDNPKVKLVNLHSLWDWEDKIIAPYQYPCNSNAGENINGGFSPTDDAYYFGHTIVDMYKNWYGMNALQQLNGSPMKLVMRVHFGQGYDNAFWDGQYMSFGDGSLFYPLVSLDVAGHEVTHGFTEQHSNLEYHDESGALNESISDMAGQTSRAYLLSTFPQLYSKVYLTPNEVTWGIGETIVRDSFGKALRFMDFPSSDGSSADCLDKSLAQKNGAYCAISYEDVVTFATTYLPNPNDQQGYIVHTASGIFNKAFYLLSKDLGIKTAYHIMLTANIKYWTPTTDFKTAACGVMHAANDLKVNIDSVNTVFGQVGVDTSNCVMQKV